MIEVIPLYIMYMTHCISDREFILLPDISNDLIQRFPFKIKCFYLYCTKL
uniref:Uncharacterized protein n=1 Tax=Anguilla anguilla TaxID=7936 RepID=A0A0E9WFA9_ANGAN